LEENKRSNYQYTAYQSIMNFIICSDLQNIHYQNAYYLRLSTNGVYVIDTKYDKYREEKEQEYVMQAKNRKGSVSVHGFITPALHSITINDTLYQCYCITVKVIHDITLFNSEVFQVTILGSNTRVKLSGESFIIQEIENGFRERDDIREQDDDTSEVW
jgi:hypothetical protein